MADFRSERHALFVDRDSSRSGTVLKKGYTGCKADQEQADTFSLHFSRVKLLGFLLCTGPVYVVLDSIPMKYSKVIK